MFEWRDEYKCNIAEIDKQHRKLFEIGSELYDLLSLRDDFDHYDDIVRIINELIDYTESHFSYEEELMSQYGYKGLEDHRKEHQAFVDHIKQIDYDEIDREQTQMAMDMILFIANWIESHILKMDAAYKDFLHENGVY